MVRAIPTQPRTEDESDSLQEDWATLRNYPACLYIVNDPSVRWEDVSLWRVRVLGCKRPEKAPENRWIVQYQDVLFGSPPKDKIVQERKFTLGMDRAYLSLGEAVVHLNRACAQHQLTLRQRMFDQERTIREHMAELAQLTARADAMPAAVMLRGDKVVAQQALKLAPLPKEDDFADLFELGKP